MVLCYHRSCLHCICCTAKSKFFFAPCCVTYLLHSSGQERRAAPNIPFRYEPQALSLPWVRGKGNLDSDRLAQLLFQSLAKNQTVWALFKYRSTSDTASFTRYGDKFAYMDIPPDKEFTVLFSVGNRGCDGGCDARIKISYPDRYPNVPAELSGSVWLQPTGKRLASVDRVTLGEGQGMWSLTWNQCSFTCLIGSLCSDKESKELAELLYVNWHLVKGWTSFVTGISRNSKEIQIWEEGCKVWSVFCYLSHWQLGSRGSWRSICFPLVWMPGGKFVKS